MDQEAAIARLRELGIKNRDLAHRLGISEDKVSKSLRGKRRFTAEEWLAIFSFLGMDRPPEAAKERMLPVIGLVAAGHWREAIEMPIGLIHCPDPTLDESVFVVRVEGDSMDLVAPSGTHLIVNPRDKMLVTRKYYIVKNVDGETTFKQFLSDPARFMPCSTNPAHQPILVGEDAFEIVGRVVMNASWM